MLLLNALHTCIGNFVLWVELKIQDDYRLITDNVKEKLQDLTKLEYLVHFIINESESIIFTNKNCTINGFRLNRLKFDNI